MSSADDRNSLDLSRLAEPFDEADIEWRVSRAGMGSRGIYCHCLAYCTARAIQRRLDEVCGPANWRNEQMTVHELRTGPIAMQVGISIRINGEWVTKWDVSDPTQIEPVKGGFSGAMKRAGAQWGIGRYLYALDEVFAEVSESGGKGWNWASLKTDDGPRSYYWKPPALPSWALPKEPEYEISVEELKDLKRAWRDRFAPDSKNPSDLSDGFTRFVYAQCGEFPINDVSCWLRVSWEKCMAQIAATQDPAGVTADVPFDA
jgi:hypothetical protein